MPPQCFQTADSKQQLPRSQGLATVIDLPLDKKVEMTNWEKVSGVHVPPPWEIRE
jgi:hypothetical protein